MELIAPGRGRGRGRGKRVVSDEMKSELGNGFNKGPRMLPHEVENEIVHASSRDRGARILPGEARKELTNGSGMGLGVIPDAIDNDLANCSQPLVNDAKISRASTVSSLASTIGVTGSENGTVVGLPKSADDFTLPVNCNGQGSDDISTSASISSTKKNLEMNLICETEDPESPTTEVPVPTSFDLESVYTADDEDSEAETDEDEESDGEMPPEDFALPHKTHIPSVGDFLSEGETKICIAGHVISPSEFYLTFAENVPGKMENFVQHMSDAYKELRLGVDFASLGLDGRPQLVKSCSIVACINPRRDALRQKEVVRAKIIRKLPVVNPDISPNPYLVLLIDLGVQVSVDLSEMFFLYKNLIWKDGKTTNAFAIKCRFHLDPFYDDFHQGKLEWTRMTIQFMIKVLQEKNRKLETRFVRQVPDNMNPQDKIWEVSILSVEPEAPLIKPKHRIERLIIKRSVGEYHDEKRKERKRRQAEGGVASVTTCSSSACSYASGYSS